MNYTITFDEQALNLILTGLGELPAKLSREIINSILKARDEIEKETAKKEDKIKMEQPVE